MLSIVLITSLPEKANALGEALGWGPNNFSVPLTESKFGLHTWAEESFLDSIEPSEDFTQGDIDLLLADLIRSDRIDSTNHFEDVLAENGLSRLE